jgi:hypothetical protein
MAQRGTADMTVYPSAAHGPTAALADRARRYCHYRRFAGARSSKEKKYFR